MELKFILESLLFSAQKPLSVKELREVLAAAAEAEDADATAKSLEKTKDERIDRRARTTRRRPRNRRAQLPARVRRRFVAVRHAAGICAVAPRARRHQGASAAAFAARAGDARHHRVSPAHHARRGRADSRRERGRHDADHHGTRSRRDRWAARKSWAARRLTARRRCSSNTSACAVWKICPPRTNSAAFPSPNRPRPSRLIPAWRRLRRSNCN